jgi:hypothetical protein
MKSTLRQFPKLYVSGPACRWRCIAYSDGTTGEIMSLTDEGRL